MSSPVLLEGRLHPVTPWRRTWAAATAIATFLFRDLHEWISAAQSWPRWVLALIAAGLSLVAAAYGHTSWRMTTYQLASDALHVRTGILFQRHRRTELIHLQAAETHRPFWGRPAGVCTLRLSASGQSTKLSYLGNTQAAILCAALLEHMAADTPEAPEAAPGPSGQVLLSVPARRLALSLLLEAHTMIRAAVALAFGAAPYAVSRDPMALLSLAGAAGAVWRMSASRLPRWHGWTLSAEPGGYRADFGLFDQQHQTFRHERTQAVLVVQPILWRRREWVRIMLATAGHHHLQILAPVATRDQAEHLIGDLYGPDAVEVMRTRAPAPRRARWSTPRSRVLSFSTGPAFACSRHRRFLRDVVHLCPTTKVQHIATVQGPWQRRLRLATVHLTLAGGPDLIARDRDALEASRHAAYLHAHN